jgi:hypothetical protein
MKTRKRQESSNDEEEERPESTPVPLKKRRIEPPAPSADSSTKRLLQLKQRIEMNKSSPAPAEGDPASVGKPKSVGKKKPEKVPMLMSLINDFESLSENFTYKTVTSKKK